VRGAMLDELGHDYVRTARAKGASPLRVWLAHALRNALLPLTAVTGLQVGTFIAYTLLTETVFQCPGMGFLLWGTKGFPDCSLYFGATWLVTLLVVLGVLLMVLASNIVAGRVARFSFWFYAPLFASLVLLIVVPRETVLALGFAGRLAWTILVVPLPVFFAGLIFSTGFRDSANPAALFGANLIGAMIGGFAEYLGMAVGSHHLSYLVIAAYAGSLLCLLRDKPGAAPAASSA